MSADAIAIIPARGGSKRIPRGVALLFRSWTAKRHHTMGNAALRSAFRMVPASHNPSDT